ncbi:MAG: hypothetical protein L7U87_08480 [Chlamydiales bacterium]|nr:hypothetical protein [Chlamydiales bacterium]
MIRPAISWSNTAQLCKNTKMLFTTTAKKAAFMMGALEVTRMVGCAAKDATKRLARELVNHGDFGGYPSQALSFVAKRITETTFATDVQDRVGQLLSQETVSGAADFAKDFFNPDFKKSAKIAAICLASGVAISIINQIVRRGQAEGTSIALGEAALGTNPHPNYVILTRKAQIQLGARACRAGNSFNISQPRDGIFGPAIDMLEAASYFPRAAMSDLFRGCQLVNLDGSPIRI